MREKMTQEMSGGVRTPPSPSPSQPLAPWLRALRALSTLLAMVANIGRARRKGMKSAAFDAGDRSGQSCYARSRNAQALCSLRSDCRALAGSEGEGAAADIGGQSWPQRKQLGTRESPEKLASRRPITLLVMHCSDTRADQSYTLEMLKRDHARRGFGQWPGYHLYVRRDGTLHYCRPIAVKGCHVKGYNAHSIGICYEGGHAPLGATHKYEDNRTEEQKAVIHEVLALLREYWPQAQIVGHRELCGGKKACPCYDVRAEVEGMG